MARRNCGESWQAPLGNIAAMPIAIFDLDGTITHRDTLFPLVLRQLARRPLAICCGCCCVVPAALRFAFDRDRGALKQSLLRATLRGTPRAELARRLARTSCATPSRIAASAMRWPPSAAIATRATHLVLMSASVDFYVPEFGRQLGFDQVISTGVALEWRSARRHADHSQSARRGKGALPARAGRRAQRQRHLRLRQQRLGSAAPATRATRPAGERQSRRAPRRGSRSGVATAEWI